MPDKTFNPDQMQSIVDRLKAEGRMPTPERLQQAIARSRAAYHEAVAKARKKDQARKRSSKRTS